MLVASDECCICAFCNDSDIEMPEYVDGRQISTGLCWCNMLDKAVEGIRCEANDERYN